MEQINKPEELQVADFVRGTRGVFMPVIAGKISAAASLIETQYAKIQEIEGQRTQELHAYELTVSNFRAKVEELEAKLVAEASRTAEAKLRADQMSQQHSTQAALNSEARKELAEMKAPQCLHLIAEPAEDIWPCINIDVDEHGAITNAKLYSPGLPAGNHDVYPVRVPYMDEHTEAWLTCVKELERFDSSFLNREGMNGLKCAASVIRELVSHAQRAAAPQAVQAAVAVDAAWMEQIGFELHEHTDGTWMVIDDCGNERPANLTERVLWGQLIATSAIFFDATQPAAQGV